VAKIKRRKIVGFEVESTYGTAETIVAADATLPIFNVSYEDLTPVIDREASSALSMIPGVVGAQFGRISFETDMRGDGSGGIPTNMDDLFEACGMSIDASSQVASPETSSAETLTIAYQVDGLQGQLFGCMGNWGIRVRSGEAGRFFFEFTGMYQAWTDTALLAPTFDTVKPPRFSSTSFSAHSTSLKVSEFEFNMNNEVVMREDPNTAAGYCGAFITNRNPTITIDPEASAVATFDSFGKKMASTEGVVSWTCGSANNQVAFSAPKAQIKQVDDADRNGLYTHPLTFGCNRSAAAGDDEVTITWA
jgi:hypothetical protein